MRAVLCRAWGEPSTLEIEEVKRPVLEAGEVRISIRASGINFADALMVAGKYQFKPPFPFSPGFEVSGVVAEVSRASGSATRWWPRYRTAGTPRRSWSPRRTSCGCRKG